MTGGSTGIGKAVVRLAAREPGLRVAFSYYRHETEARVLAAELEHSGTQAMAVHLDLADQPGIEAAVSAVAGRWGGIDALVNNAVQWPTGERWTPFERTTVEGWEQVVSVNLLGTIAVTRAVIPLMRRNTWGRIVTVSSDLAVDSISGAGPYSTLKSALFGMTANLVEELSPDGILTNVVLPSWTLTERNATVFPQDAQAAMIRAFPTGRATSPEDVASVILFLASAANGHVNGEQVRVTGSVSTALMSAYARSAVRAAGRSR